MPEPDPKALSPEKKGPEPLSLATLTALNKYRADLSNIFNGVLGMSLDELRDFPLRWDALKIARAQRDDLRELISQFLRLANAELNDETMDSGETLCKVENWIREFQAGFERERKRTEFPEKDPQPKTEEQAKEVKSNEHGN